MGMVRYCRRKIGGRRIIVTYTYSHTLQAIKLGHSLLRQILFERRHLHRGEEVHCIYHYIRADRFQPTGGYLNIS